MSPCSRFYESAALDLLLESAIEFPIDSGLVIQANAVLLRPRFRYCGCEEHEPVHQNPKA